MARFHGMLIGVGLSLLVSACSPTVQQDRSIRVSGDGKAAAFQGDDNAIFVKDLATGELRKIFDAPKGTLATSAPRWNNAGDRLVFCTAEPIENVAAEPNSQPPADGFRYTKRAVRYACWLYEKGAAPKALFRADCNHVGYIGADLAVRWAPDASCIEYVQSINNVDHSLFRYDFKDESTKRIFPGQAAGLVFGRSPDGKHLYCLAGAEDAPSPTDGLWIEEVGQWWHAPGNGIASQQPGSSLLEQLRRAAPVWSKDSQRLAIVGWQAAAIKDAPGAYILNVVDLQTHQVVARCRTEHKLHQVHWHPDQRRLGVLVDEPESHLYLVGSGGQLDKPLFPDTIREFAGWNESGQQMAYVASGLLPGSVAGDWAFLFVPNSAARDSIHIADLEGKNGRTQVSGLRATFLRWADQERLSAWLTFEPTYRSWFSINQQLGLRAGDPAAIIDVKTGKLDWMPTRGFERAQLGHYHLLRKEFGLAEEWYRRAEPDLSNDEKDGLLPFRIIHALGSDHRANPEVDRLVEQFYSNAPKLLAVEGIVLASRPATAEEARTFKPNFPTRFARDAHLAEAFLSLEDVESGRAWFTDGTRNGDARLSRSLIGTQFLLLTGRWQEYLTCLGADVLPALIESPAATEALEQTFRTRAVLLAALPLASSEFLSKFPQATLVEFKDNLVGLREKTNRADEKVLFDMLLKCIARQLNDRELVSAIEKRLPKHEKEPELWETDLPELLQQFRTFRALLNGGGLEAFLSSGRR